MTYFVRYRETCPLIGVVDPDEPCLWYSYVVIPQPRNLELTAEEAIARYGQPISLLLEHDTWDDMKQKYDM